MFSYLIPRSPLPLLEKVCVAGKSRAIHEKEHSPMKRLSRFNKVLITVGLVAASGGASLGITSLVSADAQPKAVSVVSADESPAEADEWATTEQKPESKPFRHDKGGMHSEAVADLFGMTIDELREELHSGKSLAAIAEEKSVAVSKVADVLVAEFSTHLEEKLQKFKDNVDDMVNMTPPLRDAMGSHGEGGRGGYHGGGGHHF